MITDAQLIATLDQLDIYFIANDEVLHADSVLLPIELLCGLASTQNARLRSALIPTFLQYPAFSNYVVDALNYLDMHPQNTLRCYYAAAAILQEKYGSKLKKLCGSDLPLPDFFSKPLNISVAGSSDNQLKQLAKSHAELSGRDLNWVGTYEHAYQRFVKSAVKQKSWA